MDISKTAQLYASQISQALGRGQGSVVLPTVLALSPEVIKEVEAATGTTAKHDTMPGCGYGREWSMESCFVFTPNKP